MENSQKGFVNIALVVVIIAIIAVGGYFTFIKKSEPIAQQPITTPVATETKTTTPTPTKTVDFAATWKTYTNTQYGFAFQYPSNWGFDDQSANRLGGVDVFVMTPTDNDFGKNTMNVVIDTLHTLSDRRQYRISDGYQEKIISVGGGTVYTYSKNGVADGMHLFTVGGKVFQISFDPSNPTITQIISTFKFTNTPISVEVSNVLPSGSIFTQGEGANIPLSWGVTNPPSGATIYLDLLSSDGSESLGRITNNPDCSKGGDTIALATSIKSYKWDGLYVCSNWQAHLVNPGSYKMGVSLYSASGTTIIANGQSNTPFSIQK